MSIEGTLFLKPSTSATLICRSLSILADMVGEIKGSFKILIYFSYSLSTMLLKGMLHNLEYRRLDTITIGKTYDDLYAHIKEDVGYA